MKKVKKKNNYFIYLLVTILALVLVFYIREWHKTYQSHQLTIPVISQYLNEVKWEELDNYLINNANLGLYICTTNESKCREFESNFKEIINKYSLGEKIVYLNISNIDTNDRGVDFKQFNIPDSNVFFDNYPSLVIFIDHKFINSIVIDDNVDMGAVIQFLEEHEVINGD
ncbi:MAG: DUF6568 family protein [Bacilli bacterium]|jgi:hypothetical protein